MGTTRRDFVIGGCRTFGACSALVGSGLITGCASAIARSVTASDGVVRLSLADYPELRTTGGAVRLLPEGSTESMVVSVRQPGEYVAVSLICTHLGCAVDVAGDQLVCPCHGSAYARDGRLLRGPAQQALRRFPVSVATDGTLSIELRGTP